MRIGQWEKQYIEHEKGGEPIADLRIQEVWIAHSPTEEVLGILRDRILGQLVQAEVRKFMNLDPSSDTSFTMIFSRLSR